jgi:hypothetical protein
MKDLISLLKNIAKPKKSNTKKTTQVALKKKFDTLIRESKRYQSSES